MFACRERMAPDAANPARRSLVLISDGEDNHSKASLEEAIAAAQATAVSLFSVSTNDSGIFLPGDRTLAKLAESTGGRAYSGGTRGEVKKSLDWIALQLRTQYAITYIPSSTADSFHPIRISSSRRKVRITAPEGYYSGPVPLQVTGKNH